MKKLYPSSAGFMLGAAVVTPYNSGCMRHILLQSKGLFADDIDPKYQELGALNEDRYEKEVLQTDPKLLHYDKEYKIKQKIGDTEVYLVGRIDFLVRRADVPGEIIHENKSSDSANTLREVIKKGNVKSHNLAQIVVYMIARETQKGKLIYSHYKKDKQTKLWVMDNERAFKITISDAGVIMVDGVFSGYTVQDQLAHQNTAARVIENDLIYDRPLGWDDRFKSPCAYCPWSKACDKYDNGEITTVEQFVEEATQLLSNNKGENDE